MVAAFKQVNADSTTQGADASGLFDTTGGTVGITADVAASVSGTGKGTKFTVASAVSDFGGLTYTDGSQPGAAGVLIVSGAPGAQSDFCRLTNAGTVMAKAILTTGKIFQIQDAGGTARYTSGSALADGIYWFSFTAVKGTTTSNGHVYGYLDQLVSGAWSSVSIGSDPGAVCNTGTANATVSRFGKTSATGTFNVLLDRCSISQGSTAKIDAPVVNTPPTLTADSDLTVEPWAVVSTSCIAGDPDETLPSANYTCTQTAGPTVTLTGSGNSRLISGGAPAVIGGTTLTFQWKVTDSSGADSNTDSQSIVVYPPENFHLRNGTSWQPMRIQSMA